MSDISDEFSAFDLSEFTEEDFRQIDADIASRVGSADGGPSLTIELESLPVSAENDNITGSRMSEPQTGLSPYEEFRSGGVFSVTDLAAPSWCEVQFDYGLRQKRSRPVASRPKTFRSAQGKEISVKETVAIENDEITKRGKVIHKELEREIGLEETKVDISSNEERWALRLVNMLREMPVFGILQDQPIVGIIDEIEKRPQKPCATDVPQLFSPTGKARRAPSPSRPSTKDLTPLGSSDIHPKTSNTFLSNQQHALYLVDTKTRRSNTLPPFEDTLSSRIQLMLYYRLLKELMSVSTPFNFLSLWERLHLRPFETFSTRFLVQAGLLVQDSTFPMTSLDGLAKTWTEMVQNAQATPICSNLTIIYRLQPPTPRRDDKGKRKMRTQDSIAELGITREDWDLARAIEASLSDAPLDYMDPIIQSPASITDTDLTSNGAIIGTKEFTYDEDFLDERLAHILRWWHGHRKPEGVSLQNYRRCFSCEYETHCEWREQKAAEFRDNRIGQTKLKSSQPTTIV